MSDLLPEALDPLLAVAIGSLGTGARARGIVRCCGREARVDPLTARRFGRRRLGIVACAALAVVAVATTALAVVASPPQLWAKRYVKPLTDEIRAAAISPDGSTVFVTGISFGRHQDDYATVAYDAASGVRQWVRRYNGSGNGPDHAYSIAASPDGTKVFVTGVGYSHGRGQDFATIAYDASTGADIWSKRYSSPGFTSDLAWSVAVNPDGSAVYVTGEDQGVGGTGFDLVTIAYDASTGTKAWFRRFSGPGSDGGDVVAVSPDGMKVIVAGHTDLTGATTDYAYAAVAFDAITGDQLWVRRYAGAGIAQDHVYGLTFSPDGGSVFVTGNSEGAIGGRLAGRVCRLRHRLEPRGEQRVRLRDAGLRRDHRRPPLDQTVRRSTESMGCRNVGRGRSGRERDLRDRQQHRRDGVRQHDHVRL